MTTPVPPTLSAITPAQFAAKWTAAAAFGERQAAQEMFLDLCALVAHPTPAAYANPNAFTFEKPVPGGFADAYLENHFGWEFKARDADLDDALNQLLRCQVHLKTPPLLIVSSFRTIRIRTNFPGMETVLHQIPIARLHEPAHLELLQNAFFNPNALRPDRSVAQVTEETAALFHHIVTDLEQTAGEQTAADRERLARHLNRIVFCLYAQDAGLLPAGLFSDLLRQNIRRPELANRAIANLFQQMAHGGIFGANEIPHFNGDLFRNAEPVALSPSALQRLAEAAGKNWRNIEPSIFGALFERALDAAKRTYLGAHYTSAADIMLVVDPVVMAPLRREWQAARQNIDALLDDANADDAAANAANARAALDTFRRRLASVTVLDPACGSGNFLYIALRELLDLEKQVIDYAAARGWHGLTPLVQPNQMLGIELEHYAAELARTALWIGYIQWHRSSGFPYAHDPILTPLDTIRQTDAILDLTDAANPTMPEWPPAEFIIGNPPFLGRRSWNANLTGEYIRAVDRVYRGSMAKSSDLCCYWFELARRQIAAGQTRRAGLLATQNIRATFSRGVLERINNSGGIFMAYPDRQWLLDGANVNVAIIGFDDGSETDKTIDDQPVQRINANLTAGADVTAAQRLAANAGIAFRGPGTAPFDIDRDLAAQMLSDVGNPNRRPNSDVIMPVRNGQDLSSRPRGYYTINFGSITLDEAAQYAAPFEYAKQAVVSAGGDLTGNYWQYRQSAQSMMAALSGLPRFIGHSVTAKHLTFVWVEAGTICNSATNVFARDDDYFFGILHSRIHQVWARALGTQLADRPRYTPTTCFETFPFPQPTDQQRAAIAAAAHELNRRRENWLNPPAAAGAPPLPPADLRRHTLTNLYNRPPTWLTNAHAALDTAVAAAYVWPANLEDADILRRLLALNLAQVKER